MERAFWASLSDKEFILGEIFYHPYWIGKVLTSKYRPLFGDKRITYYVVCNARDGSYLVLHGIPRQIEAEPAAARLIPLLVTQAVFEGKIMREGIETHINRQFIMGPPRAKSEGSSLLYIPVQEIRARWKKYAGEYKTYYLNVFTGRIERQ
jgi:hypothetical protein